MLRSAKNPVLQCDIHSLCLQRDQCYQEM